MRPTPRSTAPPHKATRTSQTCHILGRSGILRAPANHPRRGRDPHGREAGSIGSNGRDLSAGSACAVCGDRPRSRLAGWCTGRGRRDWRGSRGPVQLLPGVPALPRHMTSPQTLAAHNVDAIVAALAVPVFLLAGLPLEGWFWATALWAVNRYVQSVIERRAARMAALSGVGVLGASMLLRPWIGMLVLFLITKDDGTLVVSSVLLFLILVTIDIATRVLTHRNIRGTLGGAA